MKRVSPRKHLRALERRLLHLESRVATARKDLSFDKAEIAALKWAIDFAKKALKPEGEPLPDEVEVAAQGYAARSFVPNTERKANKARTSIQNRKLRST